ncbi:PIN domain nuclease [Ramlibacter sp. XY19]|uniref:type II toxin-antitoxin system VapC family toxin n=1 Tax=Ramlibacter paludis TaxID=2908000 RepID=UPI0023D9B6A4|nr:PIN domain nuclease [Ramlibacter paludis]MCG2591394.1 PIN domain nuclease [Ramlibacter paludis]
MLLVDSSVWIDRSLGVDTQGTRFVDERDGQEDIAVTGIIYQEVLQGARSDRGFEALRDMLSTMVLLEPRELSTYEIAAILHRRARRVGFTIRKPDDCLIAAVALEHGALLVHNDRDFIALAQVEPALMIYPGRPH